MDANNAKQARKIIRVSLTSKNKLKLPIEAQKYPGTSQYSTLEIVIENSRAFKTPAKEMGEELSGMVLLFKQVNGKCEPIPLQNNYTGGTA